MAELFVYYSQGRCSGLLDPSIDLIAVITGSNLSAMLIDFLANLSLAQIIDVWPPQVPKVTPAVLLCEKRSSASLVSISRAYLNLATACTLQIFCRTVMIFLR